MKWCYKKKIVQFSHKLLYFNSGWTYQARIFPPYMRKDCQYWVYCFLLQSDQLFYFFELHNTLNYQFYLWKCAGLHICNALIQHG